MAREKGTGSLQREKNGRYTLRVGINGKRYSRSTGTQDRDAAERFARHFLSPYGLGPKRLPLAEVWFEYERSPNRRDLAPATLASKRHVWMHFARWMEHGHLEVSDLGQLTSDMVGEYLRCLRTDHCGTTYNNHVCILREICRTLYDKAGIDGDPWSGVRLLMDDSHTRREFTLDELQRILAAAGRFGANSNDLKFKRSNNISEWHTLFLIGIYTGLRLGDCCTLEWSNVNLERKVIQVIPQKTRKHAHGHPVTIPIHSALEHALLESFGLAGRRVQNGGSVNYCTPTPERYTPTGPILPTLAEWYRKSKWHVSEGLKHIFAAANITTSVRIEGRRYRAPEATFHSLRHTFVSLAANAGVPLAIIQSIVGHESTAMTRHYYHENEAALQSAIAALPNLASREGNNGSIGCPRPTASESTGHKSQVTAAQPPAPATVDRLRALDTLLAAKAITRREYKATRSRILAEI